MAWLGEELLCRTETRSFKSCAKLNFVSFLSSPLCCYAIGFDDFRSNTVLTWLNPMGPRLDGFANAHLVVRRPFRFDSLSISITYRASHSAESCCDHNFLPRYAWGFSQYQRVYCSPEVCITLQSGRARICWELLVPFPLSLSCCALSLPSSEKAPKPAGCSGHTSHASE